MLQQRASESRSRLVITAACVGAFLLAAGAPASAQVQIFPSDVNWAVTPGFSGDQNARNNISGAACTAIGARGCLAVNDSSNFAQFFALGSSRLTAAIILPLQPDQLANSTFVSVAAEGAAFDDDHFYVIGSRGKVSPASDEADFLAFRFKLDSARPPASSNLPPVERSVRVRDAIGEAVQAGRFGPPLPGRPRIAVGGIAVRDGKMLIGLRAPAPDAGPFLMTLAADAVFGSGNLNAEVKALDLGNGIGIRDLATISTGTLILTGPSDDAAGAPSLFHFNESTGAASLLGNIVSPTDRKADTLLVLQEDPEFIRFLLLFEGVANGGPIEYFVSR